MLNGDVIELQTQPVTEPIVILRSERGRTDSKLSIPDPIAPMESSRNLSTLAVQPLQHQRLGGAIPMENYELLGG